MSATTDRPGCAPRGGATERETSVRVGFVLVFLVLSAAPGLAQVARFDDVPPTHPYFPAVQELADLGITAGCSVAPPPLLSG
jgi:hypothetical protein